MPTLPTQSFATIVENTVAGIQGRASKLINFAIGSTLRAIAEGFAAIFLWFQSMMLLLLASTRLSTSVGNDVDTFTADFMPLIPGTASPRLGAQASSGQVTFTRLTPSAAACFVPVGAIIKTNDGAQSFTVIADTTYATYQPSPPGYVMAPFVGSLIVPVVNTVAGSAGNIAAGALSVISTSITGVDNVVNNAAFSNGTDFESDTALKKRFSDYILGLARGDYYGLASSIEGAGVTVSWDLTEGYNYDGSWRPGYFFVIADDGSGNPSPSFLATIRTAGEAVRPLGMQFDVFPPVIIWATVAMDITTATSFVHDDVVAVVAANVATSIDSLGLGNDLEYTMLPGYAYSQAGVSKVTAVTLNGHPIGAETPDSASIVTSRLTKDGQKSIGYATVKCRTAQVN